MDEEKEELTDRRMINLRRHSYLKDHFRDLVRRNYFSKDALWLPETLPTVSTSAVPSKRSSLISVFCSSLKELTVHKNRILRGKLIAHPFVNGGLQTVVEDDLGGSAVLKIWPGIKGESQTRDKKEKFLSKFCLNRTVEVIEPEYQRSSIRECPFILIRNVSSDIRLLDNIPKTSAKYWEVKGDDLAAIENFADAILCYKSSMRRSKMSELGGILLSNISTCLLLSGNHKASLLFAMASTMLYESLYRPYYTAGRAAHGLKQTHLIENCYARCKALGAKEEEFKYLKSLCHGLDEELLTAKSWNQEVIGTLASENVQALLEITEKPSSDYKALKEEGNLLFQKKCYKEAIESYTQALRAFGEISDIICKQISCYNHIDGKEVNVVMLSSTALLLTPDCDDAHLYKARSLFRLGFINEAKTSVKIALKLLGANNDAIILQELLQEINDKLKTQKEELRRYFSYLERHHSMLTEEELNNRYSASPEMVDCSTEVFDWLARGSKNRDMMESFGIRVDKRVCDMTEEILVKGTFLPPGCNEQLAFQLLENAYQTAKVQTSSDTPSSDGHPCTCDEDLFKRLGCSLPFVINWWVRAPRRGLSPRVCSRYIENLHHSFTNSAQPANQYLFGTTHVSVGFVDLSELLFASYKANEFSRRPLRWIGYEASSYAVAKTLIILEMIKRENIGVEEVFQVWYSALWSAKTLRSFRVAVHSFQPDPRFPATEEVMILLDYWKESHVSASAACNEWMRRHKNRSNIEIFNFSRSLDRTAICKYLLTGKLLGGAYGSVVMFAIPQENGHKKYEISLGERFADCIPTERILKECGENISFIDSAVRILCGRIDALRRLICSRMIDINVVHQSVCLDNPKTLTQIQAHLPQSISWSNLCDYFPLETFHEVARSCSTTGTVHYVYSMNWPLLVKGTHLMDYNSSLHETCLRRAKKVIHDQYRQLQVDYYLHSPPITHEYNVTGYYLCSQIYDAWTDEFFKHARFPNAEKQILGVEFSKFDVFARSSNTLQMTYSYDTNISIESFK